MADEYVSPYSCNKRTFGGLEQACLGLQLRKLKGLLANYRVTLSNSAVTV